MPTYSSYEDPVVEPEIEEPEPEPEPEPEEAEDLNKLDLPVNQVAEFEKHPEDAPEEEEPEEEEPESEV